MWSLNDVPRHWYLRGEAPTLIVTDCSGRVLASHDLLLGHFCRWIGVHRLEPALAIPIC